MKKHLLVLLFAAVSVVASAQTCTPDPNCPAGLCPDTIVNLPDAEFNVAYSTTITAVVPEDTIAVVGQAGIDSARLRMDSIICTNCDDPVNMNLPTGLVVVCSNGNSEECHFYKNTNDCMLLTGTVTDPLNIGDWDITVITKAYVTCMETWPPTILGQPGCTVLQPIINSTPALTTDTVLGYRINVNPTGINEATQKGFFVSQNSPNPFNGNTKIEFISKKHGNVVFTVYNVIGAIVHSEKIVSRNGVLNIISFNGKNLPAGIYSYTLNNGENTVSKRMILMEN